MGSAQLSWVRLTRSFPASTPDLAPVAWIAWDTYSACVMQQDRLCFRIWMLNIQPLDFNAAIGLFQHVAISKVA